jgi:glucuronate isomerase
MRAFLNDDFLLHSEAARRLYHEHAKQQPIVDYHTHLSAADIASDRHFENLTEIWLEGDHYKWRAMRANGVAERFCTGDASPYEKFLEWARTVPNTLRNPLYHWAHFELRRYFGINDLLNEHTAPKIWETANRTLADGLTAQAILKKFCVKVVCTTNDPTDDLRHHRALTEANLPFRVLPTFRPDHALRIHQPATFLPWLEKLSAAANTDIHNLASLLHGLSRRHEYFHWYGCRLSDHGLERCPASPCSEASGAQIFAKALDQHPISAEERERYQSFLMLFFAHLDAEKGWTKQLHLGARRNVNTSALHALGPDTGFDTIGDYPQGAALSAYLDVLEMENALPQMVLYNSNPADTPVFAAVAGSFQNGDTPGKIQYGPAWWFLDQKDGISAQINALSNYGLLSHFVGMTTDSRSFLSLPRHEYFRRILCDVVGQDATKGEIPMEPGLLSGVIEDVCFRNAERYFRLPSRDDVRSTLALADDCSRSV